MLLLRVLELATVMLLPCPRLSALIYQSHELRMANFMPFHFTVWSLTSTFIAQHSSCTTIANTATLSGLEDSSSGFGGVILQLNGPERETDSPFLHERRFGVCGTYPFKHSARIQIVVLYHRNRHYISNLISAQNIWYTLSRLEATYKTEFRIG
jgi:hypothetical protein